MTSFQTTQQTTRLNAASGLSSKPFSKAVRQASSGPPESNSRIWPPGARMGSIVLLHLFFIHFLLVLSCRVLVLLVLGNQIVHVRLGLRELHLVHALPGVPMQKSFSPEHRCKLFAYSFEHFLDSC